MSAGSEAEFRSSELSSAFSRRDLFDPPASLGQSERSAAAFQVSFFIELTSPLLP
jgi:hypothetical protein